MTQLVELASGVDSLYLSGKFVLADELLGALEEGRTDAQEVGESVPFSFGGYAWQLQGHGLQKYRFRLDHPLVTIGITPSARLPRLFAQFRSEGIHSIGADGVVQWLTNALGNEGLPADLTVSRVDLHADWQHWSLTGDDRHRFVCRSRDLTTYEDAFDLTGFSFGNRRSKTITARIYDKTKEIEGTGHDWWHALWGPKFDKELPVLRTEFEFARNGLHEMWLGTPEKTLANVDRMWAYATQQWLSYRLPSGHADRDRWPVATEWEQVQRASLAGDALPMERIVSGRKAGELRRLLPGLNGYVAGFAACTGNDTIEDACAALPEHLHEYARSSRRPFCSRVQEKRAAQR